MHDVMMNILGCRRVACLDLFDIGDILNASAEIHVLLVYQCVFLNHRILIPRVIHSWVVLLG